jgi:hypothetical protein
VSVKQGVSIGSTDGFTFVVSFARYDSSCGHVVPSWECDFCIEVFVISGRVIVFVRFWYNMWFILIINGLVAILLSGAIANPDLTLQLNVSKLLKIILTRMTVFCRNYFYILILYDWFDSKTSQPTR